MSDRSTKRKNGFSLLEMTISMALGGIVLAAAVQIYIQGVQAAWTTTQRAEMQQDFRAASNILTTDLSLAGAGLNLGAAIALPSATPPVYGCAQTTGNPCYINGGSVAFPTQLGTPYLYGLIPGYQKGPTLFALQGPTDVVTVVYTDNNFYLDCYTATVTNTTTVTFSLPTPTPPATGSTNCTSPTGNPGVQAVSDSAVGLTAGDLVLFTFGAANVVAEVTANAAGSAVTFAANDALNLNQSAGVSNSLAHVAAGTTGYGTRLRLVSYYIDNSPTPPRLMQQVSGHTPIPVAENIVYLQFTYDLFNDTTNKPAVGCYNPGANPDGCALASANLLPNQITKINIANMAIDSTVMGTQYGPSGYQRMDLQTSVSARNLTYTNNYPLH
jgi:prepilin-type N-terminal cleavage/methylation domain-containing protein